MCLCVVRLVCDCSYFQREVGGRPGPWCRRATPGRNKEQRWREDFFASPCLVATSADTLCGTSHCFAAGSWLGGERGR